MKKSYSEHNLLGEKLLGIAKPRTFLQYLKSNRKIISIKIPYYEYLRGKIFVEDIKEIYGDEVPFGFDVGQLIFLLYNDFMNQIKRGGPHSDAAAYLLDGKTRFLERRTKVRNRKLKALTEHIFSMEDIEDEQVEETDEKFAYIEVTMKEEQLLRGEVLLYDLSPFLNGQVITVEEIFAIRFIDFMTKVKDTGNSAQIQNSIKSIIYLFNAQ